MRSRVQKAENSCLHCRVHPSKSQPSAPSGQAFAMVRSGRGLISSLKNNEYVGLINKKEL